MSRLRSNYKKGGGLITRNTHFTTQTDKSKDLDREIRDQCKSEGQTLLDNFLETRKVHIDKINNLFDDEGILKPENSYLLSATTFNDLYKWTMMPVIRAIEKTQGSQITVTFGIDLRDKDMRKALRDSHYGSPSGSHYGPGSGLIFEIHNALKSLETRQFNKGVFDLVLKTPRDNILEQDDINAICGTDAKPRTLVDANGVKPYGVRPCQIPMMCDDISIYFYYREDKNYEDEKGVHFIEAVGPWHKVTWLETTMMQAVYEAKLRYDLRSKGITYGEWIYSALLRCAKSICYTKEVCKRNSKNILPALFAGRRTGGLQFTLLQHLLFADNFIQFVPPVKGTSAPLLKSLCLEGELACLGTSSCDANYILKTILDLPCHGLVGTHAHELSMVSQVLFAPLDTPAIPISQVLSHYLYYFLTWKKTGGLMPMLPDTLGTRVFLLAASTFTMRELIKKESSFLHVINTARQDSGQLDSFIQNMKDYGYLNPEAKSSGRLLWAHPPHLSTTLTYYKDLLPLPDLTLMASEIDSTATLLEATQLGYDYFGAGGFYGDSVKVWDDTSVSSNSMAVKAVRVSFIASKKLLEYYAKAEYPHPQIKLNGSVVTGYPVKIGDSAPGLEGVIAPGKFSIDKNLNEDEIEAIREYAIDIRSNAGTPGKPPFYQALDALPFNKYCDQSYVPLPPGIFSIPDEGGFIRKRKSRKQRPKRRVSRSRY